MAIQSRLVWYKIVDENEVDENVRYLVNITKHFCMKDLRLPSITVRWMRECVRESGDFVRNQSISGTVVEAELTMFLNIKLSPWQAVETCAHEARHLYQAYCRKIYYDTPFPASCMPTREKDAETYEEQTYWKIKYRLRDLCRANG